MGDLTASLMFTQDPREGKKNVDAFVKDNMPDDFMSPMDTISV